VTISGAVRVFFLALVDGPLPKHFSMEAIVGRIGETTGYNMKAIRTLLSVFAFVCSENSPLTEVDYQVPTQLRYSNQMLWIISTVRTYWSFIDQICKAQDFSRHVILQVKGENSAFCKMLTVRAYFLRLLATENLIIFENPKTRANQLAPSPNFPGNPWTVRLVVRRPKPSCSQVTSSTGR
jgi:hypothetical protein